MDGFGSEFLLRLQSFEAWLGLRSLLWSLAMSLLAGGSGASPRGPLSRAAHILPAGFPTGRDSRKSTRQRPRQRALCLYNLIQTWQIVPSAIVLLVTQPSPCWHGREQYKGMNARSRGSFGRISKTGRIFSFGFHGFFLLLCWLLILGGLHFLVASWNSLLGK